METDYKEEGRERCKPSRKGRSLAGIILVIIGGLLLSREMGVEYPEWLFTWQMFLIGLGIFLGARHSFRLGGWIAPLTVGTVFLLKDFYPDIIHESYIWPCLIIFFGLWMIIRPRRHKRDWKYDWQNKQEYSFENSSLSDDVINIDSVFGGSKKKIMSKAFQGGTISSVFSGNVLDFSQADFTDKVVIDVNVVFGSVVLLVPAHWKVITQGENVFSSVEDKRKNIAEVSEKTLVIKGSVVFGSIEIKSI